MVSTISAVNRESGEIIMKSAVFYGKHCLRTEERMVPVPKADEVLLKVMACGVCGTDIHIFEGDKGAADTPPGTVLGHEFAGIIEAVGKAVTDFKPGDRVCVDPNQLCQTCDACRSGQGHFCERMTGIGTTTDGGFSQYCAVPVSQLYKIGDDVSYAEAAMAEPVACCLHGIDLCDIKPGSTVLIIGGGMIGLIMLQLTRLKGAVRVILTEPSAVKRQKAGDFGSDLCIDPLKEDVEVVLDQHQIKQIDVVIECVGKRETIEQAIRLAGKNSTVMMFGLAKPEESVSIYPYEIFKKEIVIKASFINPYTQGRAVSLINGKIIDVNSLIHEIISLDELEAVLSDREQRNIGKYVVNPCPARDPVRLTGARAWRTYLGGKMLDRFHGNTESEDGHFPEEWIASLVPARNAGREDIEEGLSMLAEEPGRSLTDLIRSDPAGYLGYGHVKALGESLGMLVKLIDSAERLSIQVHPDKETAKRLFGSEYGKTECWHILDGREIDGQKPCVYVGFREGVTKDRWKDCFERQDIPGLLDCLHRFEVKTGDTILIEGGVPHAIGAGCFLVEIQEPTDYTIRVEKTTPSGFAIDDVMCHQGLGFDNMFECFRYEALSAEEIKRRWFLTPAKKVLSKDPEGGINSLTGLVGYADTPCFAMDYLTVDSETELFLPECLAVYILDGSGEMITDTCRLPVKKGEQYFIPAGTGNLKWKAENGKTLALIQCSGPEK